MSDCRCPVLPAFDELTAEQLDAIGARPLCCVSCGQELELRCPEGHVHRAPRLPRGRDTKPRNYRPKPCTACRETFTPTGPRDNICSNCRGGAT
jgi:hypothetical protein